MSAAPLRHIFDVLKVNMFGVKQQRILVLEEADDKAGTQAHLQVCLVEEVITFSYSAT